MYLNNNIIIKQLFTQNNNIKDNKINIVNINNKLLFICDDIFVSSLIQNKQIVSCYLENDKLSYLGLYINDIK